MYKPNEAKSFGAAIKQLLNARNLSQRQFAKQAGLEASYVSKLVNPKPGKEIAEPSKKIRQKLAKGLGLTEQELLEQIAQHSNLEAEEKTSNSHLAEREEAIAKPQRESVESDAGSIEERIFKATSQLDPERPMFSRIIGIQALGEIAKDSPRYHWQIMEVLAAFVRTNVPRKEEEEGDEERSPKLPDDIQAALTVIGRRDSEKDPPNPRLDLSNTDIRGAVLTRANLQGAILSKANLQGAYLKNAKFQGADFNEANLQEAKLWEAELQKAKLQRANLKKAVLNGAELQGAILDGANIEFAYLWYVKLQEARLNLTNLTGVILCEADLKGATLDGAWLKGAVLNGTNMEGVFLDLTHLEGANLSEAKNLESRQLETAFGDSTTLLPYDVEAPTRWLQSGE